MTEGEARPKVSVVMPSYNHAAFLRSAAESVLTQSFSDLELVIVDDGSRDGSQELITALADPRVRHRLLPVNGGACAAMNLGIEMSRGDYIAVCNSDDEWVSHKLETQVRFLDSNPEIGAVFSDVEWIDRDGRPMARLNPGIDAEIFRKANRSRWRWLRDLVEGGNCLCHPSVLIRRRLYDLTGRYDNRLRQLPDFAMWTRLVQHSEIFVLRDRLVRFRLHDANTSSRTAEVTRRDRTEYRFILQRTFDEITPEAFIRSFGSLRLAMETEADFAIEKALYLLSYRGNWQSIFRQLGLEALYRLLGDPAVAAALSQRYGLDIRYFHDATGVTSTWLPHSGEFDDDADFDAQRPIGTIRTVELVRILGNRLRTKARLMLNRRQ